MKAAFLVALVCVSSTEGFSGRLQYPPSKKSFKSKRMFVTDIYSIFVKEIYTF